MALQEAFAGKIVRKDLTKMKGRMFMFTIETFDYSDKRFEEWELSFDYHCVYILENGKDAYIGETSDPVERGKQHDSNSPQNKNKKYFDNKVKRGVTDEELSTYILNTYAVFLTRGIMGTYVYVCDDNLREYLKEYISCDNVSL